MPPAMPGPTALHTPNFMPCFALQFEIYFLSHIYRNTFQPL